MGFMARLGMKAELKRLQPFFSADERFIEVNLCALDALKFHDDEQSRSLGSTALSFTNKAVYVRVMTSPDVIRLPYETIVDVLGNSTMLQILTTKAAYVFSGSDWDVDDKMTIVGETMKSVENVRRTIDVPGGKVRAVNRPFAEGKPSQWLLERSPEINLESPEIRSVVCEALASEIERFGPITFGRSPDFD